jgi:2-polyprenyl-3-methyl-5-hydroxy-6-metoxy-1,4-benzoquinol methylase
MPVAEDLHEAYERYMTHTTAAPPGQSWLRRANRRILSSYLNTRYSPARTAISDRLLAPLLCLVPGHRWDVDATVFGLTPIPGGRLLEIGCGDGSKLEWLEHLGWQAEGLDVDQKAVENARQQNRPVHSGDLFSQGYPERTFDAVVMSHVIEHVVDPSALIRECHRIMKAGARLVLLTPNSASWGHELYGSHWLPLDPPRHLHLFTSSSLRGLCERAGFRIERCRTTPRARAVFLGSRRIAREGRMDFQVPISLSSRLWMEGMETVEWLRLMVAPQCGEELYLVAGKE